MGEEYIKVILDDEKNFLTKPKVGILMMMGRLFLFLKRKISSVIVYFQGEMIALQISLLDTFKAEKQCHLRF